jgi:hypothetical protein
MEGNTVANDEERIAKLDRSGSSLIRSADSPGSPASRQCEAPGRSEPKPLLACLWASAGAQIGRVVLDGRAAYMRCFARIARRASNPEATCSGPF